MIHHIDSDAHRFQIAKTGSVPPRANAIHCGSSEELRQQGEVVVDSAGSSTFDLEFLSELT